jgi:hypothetical protein
MMRRQKRTNLLANSDIRLSHERSRPRLGMSIAGDLGHMAEKVALLTHGASSWLLASRCASASKRPLVGGLWPVLACHQSQQFDIDAMRFATHIGCARGSAGEST